MKYLKTDNSQRFLTLSLLLAKYQHVNPTTAYDFSPAIHRGESEQPKILKSQPGRMLNKNVKLFNCDRRNADNLCHRDPGWPGEAIS